MDFYLGISYIWSYWIIYVAGICMTRKDSDIAMTRKEYDELMKLEKQDLILHILALQDRVAQLEEHNTEMGWRLNPDRMGGQFTEEEKNRTGWL